MSAPRSARFLRQAVRNTSVRPAAPASRWLPRQPRPASIPQQAVRCFSGAPRSFKGITPESEDPEPRSSEPLHEATSPTPLDPEEYHERAETYLEEIVSRVEELQEKREDIEVEYAAGVLNLVFPPNGTYVLNKQPPNKQIWLSSPISGPKRFDWVVSGESMHQKEGSGIGDWIYLRDGSSLTAVLRKELGITVGEDSGQP